MTDKALPPGRIEAPGRGIACMIAGSLLLTMNDAVVKWVSSDFQLGQILLFRGLAALAVITLALYWRKELHIFQVRYPGIQLLRAALMIASTYLFISGLRLMPLAENVAVAFVGPIFVTALAPLILAERVGWRRWTAVLVGFAGVLVMLRPGGDGLNWAALYPAGAALCGAFRDLLTRRISHTEASGTTLFYSTLGVTLAGGVMAPFAWQPLGVGDLGLFGLAGILLCAAHFLHIETFRFAEAALVTPFKYSSLLWAGAIGFLLWGDTPDRWTILGAGLLIGSGLYIFHRESRQSANLAP
ncbi:MAG: DMT family transporter [Rhodospirillaceae bacterium]|jgi:drug/metabolite transporter (DMT)-like permease|nr:DMT family transporter [Rhodospirillaceae bacterium]